MSVHLSVCIFPPVWLHFWLSVCCYCLTSLRLAVDTDDLAKQLQSDAYSSLKSGGEAENGSSASFMGKEQTDVASANGVGTTFVAAVQECRKSRDGPELIQSEHPVEGECLSIGCPSFSLLTCLFGCVQIQS